MFDTDSKVTALILAPHTDDGEFGCGGTITRLARDGSVVHYAALSAAEKSVRPGLSQDVLRREVKQAVVTLGIPLENLRVLRFVNRSFPEQRQEILDALLTLRDELKPDVVFLPSSVDTHQDHQVVSAEGFRAFKKVTVLGYELPWNNQTFRTDAFVPLSKEDVAVKAQALQAYKSQASRDYAASDFIWNLARVRGTQIGVQYAEAFEVVRWIMR